VRVRGSILSEGEPISINMELLSGKGATGEVSARGARLQLARLDGLMYVRGNARLYRRLAGAAAPVLAGSWLEGSATKGPLATLAPLTDLHSLVDGVLAHHGPLRPAGMASVRGRDAVAVKDTSNASTLYVASTGIPYPLQITARGRHRRGGVSFEHWNEPVTLAAPEHPINVATLSRPRRRRRGRSDVQR